MEEKYRINRPGYLPVGYEVYQPKPPVDEYLPPILEAKPFFPGGYQDGKVRLSKSPPKKPHHYQQSQNPVKKKTSKISAGKIIFWISMVLLASPFVLWWVIVKIAKPDDKS